LTRTLETVEQSSSTKQSEVVAQLTQSLQKEVGQRDEKIKQILAENDLIRLDVTNLIASQEANAKEFATLTQDVRTKDGRIKDLLQENDRLKLAQSTVDREIAARDQDIRARDAQIQSLGSTIDRLNQ
jgi:chromosome segregation ATPase